MPKGCVHRSWMVGVSWDNVVTLIHRRRPMRKHVMERRAGKRLKGRDKNGRILCRHIYKLRRLSSNLPVKRLKFYNRHIYTSVAQRSVRGREDPIRGFDSRLGCACAARFIFRRVGCLSRPAEIATTPPELITVRVKTKGCWGLRLRANSITRRGCIKIAPHLYHGRTMAVRH